MRHLDITIDFETCAMSADAAPMQVAMVPWARENETDPFLFAETDTVPYVGYADLRSCVVDGFDFDPATIRWWSERNDKAKEAVCDGFAEPVSDMLVGMLDYIRRIVKKYDLESLCLWCQGTDFDIAILRSMCRRYDISLDEVVPHTQFRDCRTLILEAAVIEAGRSLRGTGSRACGMILPHQILAGSYDVYKMFEPLPDCYAGGSEAHDALYDAMRSSWNTWQALRWINR